MLAVVFYTFLSHLQIYVVLSIKRKKKLTKEKIFWHNITKPQICFFRKWLTVRNRVVVAFLSTPRLLLFLTYQACRLKQINDKIKDIFGKRAPLKLTLSSSLHKLPMKFCEYIYFICIDRSLLIGISCLDMWYGFKNQILRQSGTYYT